MSVERVIVCAGGATCEPPALVSYAAMISMFARPTLLALRGRLCRSKVRRGLGRHGAATAAPRLLRRILSSRPAPSEHVAPTRRSQLCLLRAPPGPPRRTAAKSSSGQLAQPMPLRYARSCNERRRAAQCGARRRVAQRAAARRAAGSVTHTRAGRARRRRPRRPIRWRGRHACGSVSRWGRASDFAR